MNELFIETFKHNTWANLKMIEFCRDMPPDQRDGDFKIPGTYGAIRETLQHMISSQEHYLHTYGRWAEAPKEFTNWDDLIERARKSSEAYEVWAGEIASGQNIDAEFGDSIWTASAFVILAQLLDHCTEHRTHVGTTMAQFGVQSPPVDLWSYGADVGSVTTRPKA